MKDILSLLAEINPNIEEENLSDSQLVAIYNASTWEEVEEYNAIIELFLNNEEVSISDLKPAVSFFYLKCHLLENNLIKNELSSWTP